MTIIVTSDADMGAQPASILLLDGDPEIHRSLRGILEDHGYVVREPSATVPALAAARRDPPDLVLLDVVITTPDGYAICAELKADPRTTSIPVIFISALNETFDKVRAFAVGAVDYIAKPFEVEEVLARVATHVTLRRTQRQLETQNTRLQAEIAERKQAEDALWASQARYRALVHHFPNGAVFLFDHDLRFSIADGMALRAAGFSAEQLEGKTLGEALPAEVAARLEPYYREVLAGDAPAHSEREYASRIYSFENVPLRDEHGIIVAGMLITQDVTEQRQYTKAILDLNQELEARVAERTAALTASLRALEESQRFSEQLAAASPALLALYDLRSGQLIYTNRNPAAALGYPPGHELQLSNAGLCELIHPDDLSHLGQLAAWTSLADDDVVEHELRIRHASGEWYWFIMRGSVFARDDDGAATQLLIAALDVTARRKIEGEISAYHSQLVQVQDAERAHIARELHDQVGQMLTALNLTLAAIADADPATVPDRLRDAEAQVRDLTAQVRQLSLNLRPAMLDDLGLLAALLWHAQRFSEQTGVQVAVQHGELPLPLSPEIAMTAYRVSQEALTNVARHADVQRATLQLWTAGPTLYVQVTDAGQGFDVEATLAQPVSGGLVGMRERVRLVGGTLSIESTPGGGAQVMAELPLGPIEPAPARHGIPPTGERSADADAAAGG